MHRLPVSERMLLWQKVGVSREGCFKTCLWEVRREEANEDVMRLRDVLDLAVSLDRPTGKAKKVSLLDGPNLRGRGAGTQRLCWLLCGDAAPHIFLFLHTETRQRDGQNAKAGPVQRI